MTDRDDIGPQRMAQWDLPLGTATGQAGDVAVLEVRPQVNFRVEKVMATDSGGGNDTRVRQFMVGQRIQRPLAQGSSLVLFFGPISASYARWDTCQRGLTISATIEFVRASTVDISLFGRAVD